MSFLLDALGGQTVSDLASRGLLNPTMLLGVGRSRLAGEFIAPLTRQGVSANQILRTLQDNGLGVRRQNLLRAVTSQRRINTVFDFLRQTSGNQVLNPTQLPYTTFHTPHRFRYVVSGMGIDPLTGQPRRQFVSILSNRHLSAGKLQQMAYDMMLTGERYSMAQIADLRVEEGWRNIAYLSLS